MSSTPLNLDVTKRSRYVSNIWFLFTLLMVVVGAYATWRDLREVDYNHDQKINQLTAGENERYLRQENHFASTDARVSALEIQATKTDAVLQGIAENVSYLRRRQEYKDRQDKLNNP